MAILAFSGPGGTGKTTLAVELENKNNFFRVPSKVDYLRKIFVGPEAKYSDGFIRFEDLLNFQKMILASQIAMESLAKDNKTTDIVIERSVLDYAAYFSKDSKKFIIKDDSSLNRVLAQKVDEYVDMAIKYANKNYDGIVVFKPGLFVPQDNAISKERDSSEIKKTDEILTNFVKMTNVPLLEFQTDDMNKRINNVLEFNDMLSSDEYKDYIFIGI